jgi:predicted lipoprotein with Yx(FWY)xxD motif
MKYPLKTLAILSIAFLSLTGCTSNNATPSPSPTASSSASTSKASSATLNTAITELGEILVGANGMTVYYFTQDQKDSGVSSCIDQCLVNWPPVLVDNEATISSDVTAKIGTIPAANGKKQVTVDGLPIYYWAKDKKPGEVTGQGVGNVWYVIAPDGTLMKNARSTSSPTKTSSPSPTTSSTEMPNPMTTRLEEVPY